MPEETRTHWRKMVDERFIGTWDIEQDTVVTISHWKKEEVFNQKTNEKEHKTTLYFKGGKKGLISGMKTNLRRIAGMYGPIAEDWIGKKITLYSSEGPNKDDRLRAGESGVRVRPEKPTGRSTKPPADDPPPEATEAEQDELPV